MTNIDHAVSIVGEKDAGLVDSVRNDAEDHTTVGVKSTGLEIANVN